MTQNLFSQKTKHIYRIIEKESGNPVKKANISGKYDRSYGLTDENGYLKFTTIGKIDSIQVIHTAYEITDTKLEENDTIYLKKTTKHLGTLRIFEFDIDSDLYCNEPSKIPTASMHDVMNADPKYSGGLLCFDHYVFKRIKELNIDYNMIPKLINVQFTLTTEGKIKDVIIENEVPEFFKSFIIEIFLKSPLWIPSRQYDEYFETRCSYNIKFRK